MEGSRGEALTREILKEALPNDVFTKPRHLKWLPKLELDFYCEEKKLALEYQGIQHYEYVPFFHGEVNIEKFEQQQARDQRKRSCAKAAGVTLIEVPYTVAFDK